MDNQEEKLDETLPLRISKKLKEELKIIAKQKERSVCQQIRAILKDYVERVSL